MLSEFKCNFMGYSYPIWIDVTACTYQSSKSYGAKDTNTQDIYVGSSAKNSEHFAKVIVTKRIDRENNEMVFKLSVDGVVLKEARFELTKQDRAGLFKKIRTKLKRIKSL